MKKIKVVINCYPSTMGEPVYRIVSMANASEILPSRGRALNVGDAILPEHIDAVARDKRWECVINLKND
jgi:hypothetical protein